MDPLVTLLIPSRNEEQVAQTVANLCFALDDLPVEVLVEHDPFGTGVGATLRRGLARVTSPWVIFVMADGSESLVCLREMIRQIRTDQYDAVWGDRWITGSVLGYPVWKRMLNRIGNRLIAWRMGSAYTDWTDLAKGYKADWLREFSWDDDFRCAVQIPVRYSRVWVRLKVVPSHWIERRIGRSSYTLRQAIRVAAAAFKELT